MINKPIIERLETLQLTWTLLLKLPHKNLSPSYTTLSFQKEVLASCVFTNMTIISAKYICLWGWGVLYCIQILIRTIQKWLPNFGKKPYVIINSRLEPALIPLFVTHSPLVFHIIVLHILWHCMSPPAHLLYAKYTAIQIIYTNTRACIYLHIWRI